MSIYRDSPTSQLVACLRADKEVSSLVTRDDDNNLAIYQLIAPKAELFPRIAIAEISSDYDDDLFYDDSPHIEQVTFELLYFARANDLYRASRIIRSALERNGYSDIHIGKDEFLLQYGLYAKRMTCTAHNEIKED